MTSITHLRWPHFPCSLPLIKKAIEENIIIVKFPPHVTDKMQPLDVTCFSPLKRCWEELLASRTNTLGPRECLSKPVFVDLLCSIWGEGLSPVNAISGFKPTGIFPFDQTKYPKERVDPRLLKQCKNWVKSGKLKELMEDLATSIKTSSKTATEQPSTSLSSAASLSVPVGHLNTQQSTSESQNPQSKHQHHTYQWKTNQ